jgi:hypothetical protein
VVKDGTTKRIGVVGVVVVVVVDVVVRVMKKETIQPFSNDMILL